MNQQAITELVKAMRDVLQQERDVLELARAENRVCDELAQQRRAGAMHDGFATVLRDLATDTGAASQAISMLGGYPR
jgi:hypothetical protein